MPAVVSGPDINVFEWNIRVWDLLNDGRLNARVCPAGRLRTRQAAKIGPPPAALLLRPSQFGPVQKMNVSGSLSKSLSKSSFILQAFLDLEPAFDIDPDALLP